jgi:hypothetical protein
MIKKINIYIYKKSVNLLCSLKQIKLEYQQKKKKKSYLNCIIKNISLLIQENFNVILKLLNLYGFNLI